jgi:hypothetical protein
MPASDPTVWTGRALQAECEKMEGVGLARLYPALAWSVCAPGHHGYPRAPDLILGKALRGRLGHQITGTTARPFLHLLKSTRRCRQTLRTYLGAGICPLACLRIVRRDFPNPMKSTTCQGVKAQLATGPETFVFNQALRRIAATEGAQAWNKAGSSALESGASHVAVW